MGAEVTINSIILIVILVVPGIFFKRFYYNGSFSKQFGSGLFADRLITCIFWGVVIQILTVLTISGIFRLTYDLVKKPLSEYYNELSNNRLPNFSEDNLLYILGYLCSSIFIGSFLGCFFHYVVRILKLDVKFPIFRFSNQWHYYFKGEILNSSDFKKYKKGKWLSTLVDALIDNGDGTNKMVSGFLTQYVLSPKTGELETLYLTEVKRYSKSQDQFVDVPGDCFIIPYSKIVDLNIRYNWIKSESVGANKFVKIIQPLFFFSILLILLIFPFFLEINVIKRVIGIMISIITWLLTVALVTAPFSEREEERLKTKGILIVASLVVILLASIGLIYGFYKF